MERYLDIFARLEWLRHAVYFFKRHFWVITSLGFMAALGRVIQLEAFGAISTFTHIILEIIIEGSRILIFVFVIGIANIKNGFYRIKHLFKRNYKLKVYAKTGLSKFKKEWLSMLANFFAYVAIAGAINFLIEAIAYETCLLITLKNNGLFVKSASEWTLILFFKNLSIIPLTIIFDALFFFWITNKLKNIIPENLPAH